MSNDRLNTWMTGLITSRTASTINAEANLYGECQTTISSEKKYQESGSGCEAQTNHCASAKVHADGAGQTRSQGCAKPPRALAMRFEYCVI